MTGFICIDKSLNMTSFYAVRKVRGITGEKKAGHAGTLDPLATGVLPIALGGATRFLELFETHDKSYTASVKLGMTTDTLDITGVVTSTKSSEITKEKLQNCLNDFKGKIKQLPPMYSAIKKDGVRLYELARKGIEVEREEREIEIYSLKLDLFNEAEQTFTFSVDCSAGTYIRTLCGDIGEKLGVGATMTSLRRTKALGFTLDDCVSVDELQALKDNNEISTVLKKTEDVFSYEKITVSQAQSVRFSNGGSLETKRINKTLLPKAFYRIYSPEGKFLGIGETDAIGENLNMKRIYHNV